MSAPSTARAERYPRGKQYLNASAGVTRMAFAPEKLDSAAHAPARAAELSRQLLDLMQNGGTESAISNFLDTNALTAASARRSESDNALLQRLLRLKASQIDNVKYAHVYSAISTAANSTCPTPVTTAVGSTNAVMSANSEGLLGTKSAIVDAAKTDFAMDNKENLNPDPESSEFIVDVPTVDFDPVKENSRVKQDSGSGKNAGKIARAAKNGSAAKSSPTHPSVEQPKKSRTMVAMELKRLNRLEKDALKAADQAVMWKRSAARPAGPLDTSSSNLGFHVLPKSYVDASILRARNWV